jgi:hypothetical protein
MAMLDHCALAVSDDGYVRLTRTCLRELALVHVLSTLDLDEEGELRHTAGACTTTITGFTEWVTQSEPVLSIGWYWRLDAQRLVYERLDHPYSNIMLVDSHRRDFGHQTSAILLGAEIDTLPWQHVVERHIREQYA